MVRPIYAHEMCDPDFSWLITTFRESHPEYVAVESSCLPVILIDLSSRDAQPPAEEQDEFKKDELEDVSEEKR